MLEVEKQFIEAAKRNDVETMKTLGIGLNANAKNVVRLNCMSIECILYIYISHITEAGSVRKFDVMDKIQTFFASG